MTNFTDLGLAAPILKALEQQGYVTPTPIQAQAIPAVMSGRDLLGIAQTGTGKTAAFSLPIINRLARNTVPRQPKTCRALILSPTRELASQIADNVRAYSVGSALTVTTVFGGVGIRPQTTALLRGVDILVATPGRLLDHMTERNISFAATEVFVLDEADQMLDLGFMPAIRRIVAQLPKVRQNLFFSATMPADIGKLAADLLKDPVRVAVTPVASTVERVEQRVILIETHKKKALLAELFSNPEISRALVFTRTKRGADRVARHLEAAGVGVASIHGNKSQGQREKALAAFRNARIRALVATDIAARGIDVDDVSHVVNYELPDVPESYVHRIGRTARAGRAGIAISFCDAEERGQLRDIERLTKQTIHAEDRRNDTKLVLDKVQVSRVQSSRANTSADDIDSEDVETINGGEGRRDGHRQSRGPHRGRDGQRSGGRDGQRFGGRDRDARHSRDGGRDGGSRDRDGRGRPDGDQRRSERPRHEARDQRPAGDGERQHRAFGDRPVHVGGEGRPRDGQRPQGDRPHHRQGEGRDRAPHRDGERKPFERRGEGRPEGDRAQGHPEGQREWRREGRPEGQRREGRPDGQRSQGRPEHRERRAEGRPVGSFERREGQAKPRDGEGGGQRHDLDKVGFMKPHGKGEHRPWRGGEQRRDGQRPRPKAHAG